MSHSVARHLHIAVEDYDRIIRQFIPGYDAMLDRAATAAASVRPGQPTRVLDLGAGTGALSEQVLDRSATSVVELWDVDESMLAQARVRLARFGSRARFHRGSYFDPLPPADAVVASLSLHHVRDLATKQVLYQRIAEALRPGGVLVNADITMPDVAAAAEPLYRQWADHMVREGIEAGRAWQHFQEWSGEDRYFPLDAELAALTSAGLVASCRYQLGPATVVMGEKPSRLDAIPGRS